MGTPRQKELTRAEEEYLKSIGVDPEKSAEDVYLESIGATGIPPVAPKPPAAAPVGGGGVPTTMAERIDAFERGKREGSPFARGVGRRDPLGAAFEAARVPARISGAFASEVIGLERAGVEQLGISGRAVDPFDIAPDTALLRLARGDLGPQEDVGIGDFVSAVKQRESERNLAQTLLLEIGADPLNLAPGVGFTRLGRGVSPGRFNFSPGISSRGVETGAPIQRLTPGQIPPSVRPSPQTSLPPRQGLDIIGGLERTLANMAAEEAPIKQFIDDLAKRMIAQEGSAPYMDAVIRQGKEGALSVHTAGWPAERLAKYGLVPAPDIEVAFGKAYRPTPIAHTATSPSRPGPLALPEAAVKQIEQAAEEGARAADAAFPNTTGVLKPLSPEVEESVFKLTALAEEAKPIQREALRTGLEARSAERTRRVGEAQIIERQLRQRGVSAQEASRRATAQLQGELPGPIFEPLQMKPDEFKPMFDHIFSLGLQYFDGVNARVALENILAGIPLAPAEKNTLEQIFGRQFASALAQPPSLVKQVGELSLDALNLPRQVLTAYDVSAPLRQGVVLLPGHPGRWGESVVTMFKALAREGSAQTVDAGIRNDSNFIRFTARHAPGDSKNLFIADLTGRRGLGSQEELFMSRLANKIPGIKQSQRAYVTFLNKFRYDVMTDIVQGWEKAGLRITETDLDELALFLNRATGRGSLGKTVNSIAPGLNVAFFAPRLLASRIQLPLSVVGKSALVRKQAAKDLSLFVGSGIGILSLLSLSSGVKVELDPRSSDFGKIQMGNTSIEFWAGFQPIARYSAQLITGQSKTITGKNRGQIRSVPRFAIDTFQNPVAFRFVRSKLSPIGSAAVDVTLGGQKDFLGNPIFGDDETSLKSAAGKQAFNRLVPLFVQDLIDAFDDEGITGLFKAAPAGLGAGAVTFPREGR